MARHKASGMGSRCLRRRRHASNGRRTAATDKEFDFIVIFAATIRGKDYQPDRNTVTQHYRSNTLNLTPEQLLTRLNPGEAYVWSSKATDAVFFREAVKLKLRPRARLHGGTTKTAVG